MEDKRNYTVYAHVFPDAKVYVGLTKQRPEDRWQNGNAYKKQTKLYNAILKYGWDNIQHNYISNLTRQEAQELESKLIEEFDTINFGYNSIKGGGLGGIPEQSKFKYKDKIYTATELLENFDHIDGLTTHMLVNRINTHHMGIDEALTKPIVEKNQRVEFNGNQYTYRELARLSDVELSATDIMHRLDKGWTVERAISQPKNVKLQPKGTGERIYEYNGNFYNTYELSKMSSVEGLTPFDIANRVHKHGWTVEKAITQPKKSHNAKFLYNGKYYTSNELVKLSPVKNIKRNTITDRIRSGWSVEDAVNTPLQKK